MSVLRSAALLTSCALLFACGDDDGPVPVDAEMPPEEDAGMMGPVDAGPIAENLANPVLVQTGAPEEIRAGSVLPVTCTILDDEGGVFIGMGLTAQVRVSPESSVIRMDGDIIPTVAGEIEVGCAYPSLMLIDESPARVRVIPGEAAEIVTTIDTNTVEAGGTATVSCAVFDAYGNRVEGGESTVRVEPGEEGNTTEGLTTTFTRSGVYDVACALGGAESVPERVEVIPTVPANLVIGKVPDEPVYGIGQVIEISSVVTDRYDNVIRDADVGFTSEPPGSTLGRNRFRYSEDGTYVVTARIDPPTESGDPLTAQTTIVVNGNGPSIQCDGPRDASMIVAAPGSRITFMGTVDDTSGVDSVTVNGEAASLDDSGVFSREITTEFGVNFVDISARDSFGTENTRTCAFIASDRYADPEAPFANSISMRLNQEAVDDRNPSDPLDSINDIMVTALNSSGLRDTLNSTLVSGNPLYNECVQDSFLGCLYRLRINYQNGSLALPDTETSELTLVTNGFQANVNIPQIRMGIDIGGTVSTSGTVTARNVNVRITFNLSLSGGSPRITVRSIDNVSIGSFDTNFSGLAGFVIDIIVDLFEGTVRDLIEDLVRDYIRDSFDELLEGLLGGLDVSTLGSTFSIPRLDGSGDIDLSFGVGFSHITTSSARMLFGFNTRFSGPSVVAYPTEGIAYPPGAVLVDPSTGASSAAVGVHAIIFNQVMHALWRAGLLETTVSGDSLGGDLPAGLTAQIRGALPPVAFMTDDEVEIGLGALSMSLVYPGLFEEPINVTLGARASTSVTLAGSDLEFGDISVDELYFSTGDVSLDAGTRDVLERFLRTLVQSLADSLLNDSLPALPIPSLEIPASLGSYGLPVGSEIGLRSPSLANEPQHFMLRSNFGEL